MSNTDFKAVHFLTIDSERHDQRIDNFLLFYLKTVPKSYVYRILRKGEVRVNKKRIKPQYRLQEGDIVRIPPMRLEEKAGDEVRLNDRLLVQIESICAGILYQNDDFLVLNKPAGLAVHGGTGLHYGLIELLKSDYHLEAVPSAADFYEKKNSLELVHRLDQGTSGCLLVAKHRPALLKLQDIFRDRQITKQYVCLLHGQLKNKHTVVKQALLGDVEVSGEKMVVVDNEKGKPAHSEFTVIERFKDSCFVKVDLITGRKHQIRVHSRYLGHAILGDGKYGDKKANAEYKSKGLNRLFLHSKLLHFEYNGEDLSFDAPLPNELQTLLDLNHSENKE